MNNIIKAARKRKALPLRHVAQLINGNIPYLSQIENNKKKPGNRYIKNLAEVLDLKIEDIVDYYESITIE